MELMLHDSKDKASKISVSDSVFAVAFREALVHQVLTAFRAGARSGTKAQKSRSEVSGGGRKPWKQKGSGRARAGTIRSPLWRGGGVTFAAKPKDYSQRVNRKMYRAAMRSIFSELVRQDRLILVGQLDIEEPKTKLMLAKLKALGLSEVLIIVHQITDNLRLASRNIPCNRVVEANSVDPYVLIAFNKVLMTKDALGEIEKWLS